MATIKRWYTRIRVVRAVKKRHVLGVSYIGETSSQRCAKDGVPFWKFTGLKDGWQHVVHACPVCRKTALWNREVPEPAEYFRF